MHIFVITVSIRLWGADMGLQCSVVTHVRVIGSVPDPEFFNRRWQFRDTYNIYSPIS